MGFVDLLLDDIIPIINILIAIDAAYRNWHTLCKCKIDNQYRIILWFGLVLSVLLATLYFLVLAQLDHVIDPDPSRFSAFYVRPLMSALITFLNLTARYRQPKAIKEVPLVYPNSDPAE